MAVLPVADPVRDRLAAAARGAAATLPSNTGETTPTAGAATSTPVAAAAAPAQQTFHDCSNDASGLELASLRVAATWISAAARQPTDMTMVTQMSPGRCGALSPEPRQVRSPEL